MSEPFNSLVGEHPGDQTHPPGDFRTKWGPIFHRAAY
jgi:uracil-DNA glycosylase